MEIQEIISGLKQIAAECEKVTSGNVSHRIANIEHGIINIADNLENYCPLGWHPASELPPLDEDGESECVIGIWEEQQFSPFITIPLPVSGYVSYEDGAWTKPIKWWCYPPKEE